MKTNTTAEQASMIINALKTLHVQVFACQSGDPKHNAQRNLTGKTHYCDDDTLRWHKSRICGTAHLHGGLLFRVTCSDALDMNNTKRGFRCAVFDVFGTCVSRPELENAYKTSDKAVQASQAEEIDLLAHYQTAFASMLKHKAEEAAELETALNILGRGIGCGELIASRRLETA